MFSFQSSTKLNFGVLCASVYLMCLNDITKSSFMNCSNSVDDAKWRKGNDAYFNVCFLLFDACLLRIN